ncbi:hypothetical protein AB0F68_06680 [Micromonospora sp. NPDC023966]|uniref:hypothetical protein n=1 Tax=Micromonospora sp. NPDC023966 TaxID=3154699 RepID=UPI0033FF77DC
MVTMAPQAPMPGKEQPLPAKTRIRQTTAVVLAELRSLLCEQQEAMPPRSPDLFPRRQQVVATLAADVGEVDDAHRQIKALRQDVCLEYGLKSAAVADVDALLLHLDRLSDGTRR